jgi:hypothetical protein
MSSNNMNDRKRKPKTIPETVSSNDEGQNPKERKALKASTNASASTAAILQVDTPPVATENAAAANAASIEHEESIPSIGKMVEDLCHSDNTKNDAALDAFKMVYLFWDKKKLDTFVMSGGCLALVLLLKKCLDKAIATIPAYDEVAELNELAELTTLYKTLVVITNLTVDHDESRVGITAIGGVKAIVKMMKTFPKCADLQEMACVALANFAYGNATSKKQAIESGGIEALLAAVTNHLNSAYVCENACWALLKIVTGSKENTGLLIDLGGAATVKKVRTKWPDNEDVQTQVRELADLIGSEMKAWADEE